MCLVTVQQQRSRIMYYGHYCFLSFKNKNGDKRRGGQTEVARSGFWSILETHGTKTFFGKWNTLIVEHTFTVFIHTQQG